MNQHPPLSPAVADRLSLYQQEALRWNRHFSLVSRLAPEQTIETLIKSSLSGLAQLPAAVSVWDPALGAWLRMVDGSTGDGPGRARSAVPITRLIYIDIGSGVGIPGLVWHAFLEEALAVGEQAPAGDDGDISGGRTSLATVLFEPREKRAWFLERCARRMGLTRVQVEARRWGESELFHVEQTARWSRRRWSKGPRKRKVEPLLGESSRGGRTLWLITLQALALTDPAVVTGWRREILQDDLGDDDRLVIVRPRRCAEGTRGLLPEIASELGLPQPGSRSEDTRAQGSIASPGHQPARAMTVYSAPAEGTGDSALLLSCYRRGGLPA